MIRLKWKKFADERPTLRSWVYIKQRDSMIEARVKDRFGKLYYDFERSDEAFRKNTKWIYCYEVFEAIDG